MTGRHAAGQTAGQNGTAPTSVAALEADIARQRAALAETVDQLHAKLDVKARVQATVHDLRARVTTDRGRPTPALVGAAIGAAVLVAAVVALRRRS